MKSLPPPLSTLYDTQAYRSKFDSYEIRVHWDGRLSYWSFPHMGVLAPPPVFPQVPVILERARPDWHELFRMVADVRPSGWLDPQMAKEIEGEFKKRQEYVLVDSADRVDLVFLVEGLYNTYPFIFIDTFREGHMLLLIKAPNWN